MANSSLAAGRSKWGALLALVLLLVLWWFTSGEENDPAANPESGPAASSMSGAPTADSSPTGSPASSATSRPSPRPSPPATRAPSSAAQERDEDGFRWVSAASLPDPALDVLKAINDGGPFEYAGKDGSTFGNYEGVLPQRGRGYYREYTVETPGLNHRGARRIVTGQGGQFYWTADHYASFDRIRR